MRFRANSIPAWMLAGAIVYSLLLPAQVLSQAPYYQGKTISHRPRWRAGGFGRVSNQSAAALSEKVHSGKSGLRNGIYGGRVG